MTERFVSEDNCCGYYTEVIDTEKELDLSLPNPKKNLTIEELVDLLNELHEENNKIKSILFKRVEELNDAYNKSAKAGMPTGAIIGELDSFEEICEVMGWLE